MLSKSNWAIPEKLIGGACPRVGQEKELKKIGVTTIVNLMNEKLQKNAQIDTSGFKYIHVPVNDHFIFNEDITLVNLVNKLLKMIEKGEVIYLHCLGGHGRTAIVAVILIAKYYNITEEKALKKWQELHATRKDLGKHGSKKSPQQDVQYYQIHRVLSDNISKNTIYFYHEDGLYGEFSNLYQSSLLYKGKKYPTSEHAFQAMKFLDSDYREIIRKANTPFIAKILAQQKTGGGYKWRTDLNPIITDYLNKGVKIREDWEKVKENIMYEILIEKFLSNEKILTLLLSTDNKTLVEHTSRDNIWGDGGDGKGKNLLGKTLMRLRDNYRICFSRIKNKRKL